jgi:DNA-binding NarL/FixJ family response regulator
VYWGDEKLSQSQFMMLTIYEDDGKAFEALSAGVTGYLLKKSSL